MKATASTAHDRSDTTTTYSTTLRASRAEEQRESQIMSLISIAIAEAGRARLYSGYIWIDRDDLVAIGMRAVIDAVDTYDASFGRKLKSHVIGRVRWGIKSALQNSRNSDHNKDCGYQWVSINESPAGLFVESRGQFTFEDVLPDPHGGFEESVMMRSMIDSLPRPHREIMEMHVYGNMDHNEIAEAMGGYDKSRVTMRLKEARRFLASAALCGTEQARSEMGKVTTRRAWRGPRVTMKVKVS